MSKRDVRNWAICALISSALPLCLFVGCSFDYGETASLENEMPDLVMLNVEYVRVKSSDPIARFEAERAERYERQRIMKLENLSFEQYGERGTETNVAGKAGFASVEIESGNIFMENGVNIEVESEDIIIETSKLDWIDEKRTMSSGEESEVYIYRQNGTSFNGTGLQINARSRTWEFTGSASGTYIHDEEDE
ncbi:MAG: LPS export ABC transporter periplasmic protein LptC [Treponema sp.]|nr:LPS export ABC transporter periplasmic protein LptC [Treponema sp.]